MNVCESIGTAAAVLVVAFVGLPAHAQFGAFPVNLPKDDFTWNWGDVERSRGRNFPDFSMTGNEGGFRCSLEGKLRLGSNYSPQAMRQLENDLRSSLYFIQEAANTMNSLDLRRDLDWATLDCDKPEASQADLEKQQQSLDKAKEKALKKMIEAREKREREQAAAAEEASNEP
jgi:hypothetical protein